MTQHTLIIGALVALASSIVFMVVGRVIQRRPVSEPARLASNAFATWWYALGTTTAIGGLQSLAASAGFTELRLYVTVLFLNLAVICVALWGLLFYLAYLTTGRRNLAWPLAALYAGYFAWLAYVVTAAEPVGVQIERWTTSIEFVTPLNEGTTGTVLILLLLLPQIVAAIAYLFLLIPAETTTQRYRIAMVGSSILVWFGISLVGASTGINDADWWQLLSRFISLGAAAAVLLAYLPPIWVRDRLGVQPVPQE